MFIFQTGLFLLVILIGTVEGENMCEKAHPGIIFKYVFKDDYGIEHCFFNHPDTSIITKGSSITKRDAEN